MLKKVVISYPEIFDELKKYFTDKDVELVVFDKDKPQYDADLLVFFDDYECVLKGEKFINVHPSILPAYKGKDAIFSAFKDGVKVSGITIHSKDNIIAQYPVLIGLDTHIDDFISEIHLVSSKLLPVVIDSILNDRVFDFSDLFSNPCHKSGGCSGCGGCH